MSVFYLDVDDEITSAAARIRSAEDLDVALVLPAGSRIATSRINFRLLAREATSHNRRLAIVAPEASSRALAASAGLPVFASVVEYGEAHRPDAGGEATLVAPLVAAPPAPATEGMPAEEPGSAHPAAGAAALGVAAIGTAGVAATRAGAHARPIAQGPQGTPAVAAGAGAAAASTGAPPGGTPSGSAGSGGTPGVVPVQGERPRGSVGASTGLGAGPAVPPLRRRRWPLVVAVLLVVALLGGAATAVGYVLLPTATVTLQLTTVPVGPVVFTGTADPDAVAVDADTATIPAVRVPVSLSATGTFKATGKRVESSVATGQVRWTNCDPTRAYTIPQGTLARTPAGLTFKTQESVFLPVAILDPPRIACQNRTVAIQAARDGPAGNVGPGVITVVPGAYNSVVIKVTNPTATSGGAREEFPQVTEKDVASATARLDKQLDEQLASVAADPPGTPDGAIAYPETARRGEAVPSQPAADLVGTEVETFDLTLTAEGTVVAADPTPLQAIGADRVAAAVPEGMQLREGSVRVTIGDGVPEGELVRYPVEGSAEAVRDITAREVQALVKGKTQAEAEDLLADYGTVEVSLWPDYVTSITTVDARLNVTVEGVPPVDATPVPTARPTASEGPAPSGAAPSPGSSAPPTAAPPTAAP